MKRLFSLGRKNVGGIKRVVEGATVVFYVERWRWERKAVTVWIGGAA